MTAQLDVLMSYAFHADYDLAAVRAAIGPDALLLIDSGAFTAHSTGKPIDRAAYADFLQAWAGVYSAAVTLDVIHDTKATRANTKWLHDRGLPVMPVFTLGGTPREFDALAKSSDYLCLGGLSVRQREVKSDYVTALVRRAADHGCGVHVLGATGPGLMQRATPYSADVSTASRSLLHGLVVLWDGRRVSATRISDRGKVAQLRPLLTAYELDVRRMLDGTSLAPDYRTTVVAAGIWSAVAQGIAHRARQPAPVPVPGSVTHGLPGTRIATALVTSEIVDAALAIGRRCQAGDYPRAVRQQIARSGGAL